MRLTVVGAAPAWTSRPAWPSSCYVMESDGRHLVLDLGQGSLGALHRVVEPSAVSAILISHLHPDHHVDLVALRHLLRFGYEGPRSVTLHAPAGLRERYDAFLGEPGFLDVLPGDDLGPGTLEIGPFSVRVRPVTHVGLAFAVRVAVAGSDGSAALVYSGDCGVASDLVPLIEPGDTLLCEAFWGDGWGSPEPAHLSATEAAAAARDGGAGCLILTHIGDGRDPEAARAAARGVYDGPVLLAEPGMSVTLAGRVEGADA